MKFANAFTSLILIFGATPQVLFAAEGDGVEENDAKEASAQAAVPEPSEPPLSATPAAAPAAPEAAVESALAVNELVGRPGGLTSDEAARQAAAYTKDAALAQADVESAHAQKDQVLYGYLPRVTLTASYTRQSNVQSDFGFGQGSLVGTSSAPGPLPDDAELFGLDTSGFNFNPLPNNWFMNAGLVVPISDYLFSFSQAITGVKAATRAAKLNKRAARLNAAANARLAYYEWARTRLRVAEAKSSVERARAQLENLRRLQEGGRVARADVLRQDAFLANAELNLRRAETREVVASKSLQVLMDGGKRKVPNWEIGENVLEDRAADRTPLSPLEQMEREALSQRLEIQALEHTAFALGQQRTVDKASGYPRIEGFANLTYANPNPRFQPPTNAWNGSWDLGVRLSWTINDLGSSRATSQVTTTEITKVELQKAQIADALHTEVLSARQSLEEARLAQVSAQRGVAAAEAAYQDVVQLSQNGRKTTLDVLQSENALVTARVNLIDAYIGLRQAEVRLEHALGADAVSQESAAHDVTK